MEEIVLVKNGEGGAMGFDGVHWGMIGDGDEVSRDMGMDRVIEFNGGGLWGVY